MALRERNTSLARNWFTQFVNELEGIAHTHAVRQIIGRAVRFRDPPFEINDAALWPRDTGWFAEVAGPRRARGTLSVWLDRYLDLGGDAHLGVWYDARRTRSTAVADLLDVAPARRYTWRHRDHSSGVLVPSFGRTEKTRIGSWLVDDWRPSEVYVGKYVVASPHLHEPNAAVGHVCQALRQLAEAAESAVQSHDDPAAPPLAPPGADRYTALMERLVRPGQARFRKRLLDIFGGRCAITGCSVEVVLDAAHIKPVSDFGSDETANGLLLRADLHRLFDDGRISISAGRDSRVMVAKQLADGPYGALSAQPVAVPLMKEQRVNLAVRNKQWGEYGLG